MRILKFKTFAKWARKEGLRDKALVEAVKEIEQGQVDAKLGKGLYKKRVARQGQGKSGGFRTLLTYQHGQRVIFLFGFAKNERDNIADQQLRYLKRLCQYYLQLKQSEIEQLIRKGDLIEVENNE